MLAAERDPLKPRVPDGDLAEAKKLTNSVAASPETIAKGKALYEKKGTCFKCHGLKEAGDGLFGENLKPSPRTFMNAEWQKARTDDELFWIIKNGSPGTGMVSLIPSDINETAAWHITNYVRTLGEN